MIILGIDPGTAIIGYGIIKKDENLSLIDYGCITTSAKLTTAERLTILYKELKKIINKYKPNIASVEKLFFCKNIKTAITVSQARGVILLTINKAGIPIFEYTPLEIKQAITSYGKAEKIQVQKMVKILLKLKKIPKPDDAADALATAICCANNQRT